MSGLAAGLIAHQQRLVGAYGPVRKHALSIGTPDHRNDRMHVTRVDAAQPYAAPKHFDMCALRLQGFDASPAHNFWVGLSHFLPGGGAESDATPLEKVYVVIGGTVTVSTDEGEIDLQPLDSCHLSAGERRSIVNNTNRPASMLVVMPYPKEAP
ncbi:MAG TPA: cupin domain-containing protein [Solirubrobacteraceae bacterium]|jgi:quercetin dioxygenase-like cupin family protein